MKKVIVTADAAGNVIVPSTITAGWGYIRVEQTRAVIDEHGFLNVKKLSALVKGPIDNLKALGWENKQELPGVIAVKESLTPFNKVNPEKNFKVAGDTGIFCTLEGKPIYRNCFYNANPATADVLISHDNGAAIVEAMNQSKASSVNIQSTSVGEQL